MSVSATPQSPKPEDRMVDPDLTSATAASASRNSFDPPRVGAGALLSEGLGSAERRAVDDEKRRREDTAAVDEARATVPLFLLRQLYRLRHNGGAAAAACLCGCAEARREGIERRSWRVVAAMFDGGVAGDSYSQLAGDEQAYTIRNRKYQVNK